MAWVLSTGLIAPIPPPLAGRAAGEGRRHGLGALHGAHCVRGLCLHRLVRSQVGNPRFGHKCLILLTNGTNTLAGVRFS